MALVGAVICIACPAHAGALAFSDDFNRPDSLVVGNGWLGASDNPAGYSLEIVGARLSATRTDGGVAVFHPFPVTNQVELGAIFTHHNGFGCIPFRHGASFTIRNDGTRGGGYGISFGRGDANFADSRVARSDGGIGIDSVPSSFQFTEAVTIDYIRFDNDGSIQGHISQPGASFDFSFGPRSINSQGTNICIFVDLADSRCGSPTHSTVDNFRILHTNFPIIIHGVVTDTNGAVVAATVAAEANSVIVAQTNADGDGNYTLPPLAVGAYAVTASALGHARSARVLTLSAGTSVQNFQLVPLPSAPALQEVNRAPTVKYTTGPMGELKVFDGTNFVSINSGNAPQPDRMTIVMTHGFASNPEAWARGMAAQMEIQGVSPAQANILCWDWHDAADGPLTQLPMALGRTGGQGVGLGSSLQARFGAGYAREIHFLGHSLGALVNAAAVNYVRGDKLGSETNSPTPWICAPIHVTLFDHAQIANTFDQHVLYDGLSVNLVEAVDRLESGANYIWDLKRSMPVHPTWADNYVSLVGYGHPNAVNVRLQKAPLLFGSVNAHSYSWWWYSNSVASPTEALNPMGFQRSYEYVRAAGLPVSSFPPSNGEFPPGSWYQQTPSSSDPLALQVQETFGQRIGRLAETVVHGAVNAVQAVGNVTVEIRDGAQAAGQWIAVGFDYVSNRALRGEQSLVNLFDSAVLRLTLRTQPAASPSPLALQGGWRPADKDGNSNSPPMAWVPIQFPANATAMAFDFVVHGNPMEDVLVCGIGETSLFSLEAKYVPTNTISASRLMDVSAWAGTTNELFFGLMGATSTNATLQIENIRFYSVGAPWLEIARNGSATTLSWPSTAGGYVVETTPALPSPTWESVSNAPAILRDRYVLTNFCNYQARFFRLRTK
jgi:hypothetical protein